MLGALSGKFLGLGLLHQFRAALVALDVLDFHPLAVEDRALFAGTLSP